jgi:hypothetical protein
MPAALRNRPADNWRVLLAIADACSPEWGEAARAAALELSGTLDEDPAVRLLIDIREIFDRAGVDRLPSSAIVAGLIDLPEGLWAEWRGPRGDQNPHRLTQGTLAHELGSFQIRSRTFWPPKRNPTSKSFKGYARADFEAAWAAYCEEGVTPSQSSKIKHLRRK